MNKSYKTEQEEFWATSFGDEYINRNKEASIISTKCSIFTDVLRRTKDVKTVLELGSNIGLNLRAIKLLKNDCELSAVEINPNAAKKLDDWDGIKEVFNKSILDFKTDKKWDMVIISGVLIHINPEFLNKIYELMSNISKKYVLISEYYTPVELDYRGHKGKLFKRDFAGEMLDRHSNFSLLDYGFVYHRDNNFPLDDGTWFLLEKS
jgi:pseudaminic acid biosynthesis-associated methylase